MPVQEVLNKRISNGDSSGEARGKGPSLWRDREVWGKGGQRDKWRFGLEAALHMIVNSVSELAWELTSWCLPAVVGVAWVGLPTRFGVTPYQTS